MRLAAAATNVCIWRSQGILEHEVSAGRSIRSIAWSPDSQRLAYANGNVIHQVVLDDLSEAPVLSGHTSAITSLAWGAGNQRLFSGGNDGTIRIWSSQGTPEAVIEHGRSNLSVVVSRDGNRIACADTSSVVRIWNADGTEEAELKGSRGAVLSVALSPDGQRLVTGDSAGSVTFWNADGSSVGEIVGSNAVVSDIAWSREDQLAIRDSKDIYVFDRDGRLVSRLASSGAGSLVWHPDGTMIAHSRGASVRFSTPNEEQNIDLQGHTGSVNSSDWRSDGVLFATCSNDKTVRLWNIDGSPHGVLEGHSEAIDDFAWSPDGGRLVSASRDGTLRVWDVTSKESQVLNAHQGSAWSVDWSTEHGRIASVGVGFTIRLWSSDGELQSEIEPEGKVHHIYCVRWSPGGQWLASARTDGTVSLWTREGEPGPVFHNNRGQTRRIAWSHGGERLASATQENTVTVRDIDTGETEWTVVFLPSGEPIVFRADGEILFGDPSHVEADLVHVIENSSGRQELLKPSAFRQRIDDDSKSSLTGEE